MIDLFSKQQFHYCGKFDIMAILVIVRDKDRCSLDPQAEPLLGTCCLCFLLCNIFSGVALHYLECVSLAVQILGDPVFHRSCGLVG